jgi:hypothetical protein
MDAVQVCIGHVRAVPSVLFISARWRLKNSRAVLFMKKMMLSGEVSASMMMLSE